MVWAMYTVYSDMSIYVSSGDSDVEGAEHYWMFAATNSTAIYCFACSVSGVCMCVGSRVCLYG